MDRLSHFPVKTDYFPKVYVLNEPLPVKRKEQNPEVKNHIWIAPLLISKPNVSNFTTRKL